jgi:hypothetical protein
MIIGCSAALMSISSVAVAQERETDRTGYQTGQTTEQEVEEARDDMQEYLEEETQDVRTEEDNRIERTGDEIERGAERTGNEIERGAERTGEEIERGAERVGQEVDRAGDEVEDETAEERGRVRQWVDDAGNTIERGAKSVEAAIADEVINDKEGPNGETVYKNNDGNLYYIDQEGDRQTILESQLRDKDNNIERGAERVEREADRAGDELERETADERGRVRQGVNDAGNNLERGAKSVESGIMDEVVDGKEGPLGETVYKDDRGKFYYIDQEGERQKIRKSQLRDKDNQNDRDY